MATYINPNAIKDRSITSIKLANGLIVTDASIAALGYIKDVSNLATKSAAIGSLSLALDSSDYKITLSGTKVDGSEFTVQNVIDLPLESVVVDGSYNNTTKKIVLTLQNGSTVDFSVADLVAGLQSEITSSNKLSADLIQDGTTNKTVTATEKQTWNSAVQPADLATVATTGAYSDLIDAPTPGPVYYALASAADLTFTKWNASVSGITSYYNGLTFIVVNGSGATVELEGSSATFNVNGLGAKTISRSYLAGGGYTAQNLPANGAILLTYYNNMFYLQAMLYNLADFYSDSTHRLVSDASTAAWNGKQDAISDLATIRENASVGAAKVSNVQSDWDATTGLATILHKPTIPSAPGTLNTNNTAAQTASASEALSGTIKLHKIAKTGTYSDLIGTPVMTSDASVAGWGYTKNTGTLTGVKFNGATATVSGSIASITATIPSEVTESTVSGWGFTKNAGTLTGIKFNGADATISGSIASISATIPAAPGTLKTNNTSAQTASASESLSGTINLHKVAKTGTYSDLIGTPAMTSDASVAGWGYTKNAVTGVKFNNADATVTNGIASITATIPAEVTESTVSGWGFTKNAGTITGITMNNTSKGTSGNVDLGTVITEHAAHKLTATNNTASATTGEITFIESLTGTNTATSGNLTITATRKKITVPSAVTSDTVSGWGFTKNAGTLTGVKFNNADATVTNGVASITATIPAAPGTLNTTATTAQSTSASEALSGNITLHKVAKTGTYSDLIGTPTIPTVNNATLTIQKNGTNVQTFTANASSNVTANITVNELPTVTSSDNGKVLMVVNGAWSTVTPVSIYSGSAAPNNSQGINGDIYLQV